MLLISSITHSQANERILHYHADITVETNAKLVVAEKIEVKATGNDIKRGIYRVLPLTRMLGTQTVNTRYTVRSVAKNGVSEPFRTERTKGALVIYIGDENTYLQPGTYAYEIVYDTDNQIGFFDDFDEVYWNVTGNDWAFAIDKVSASIRLPSGAEVQQHACYTGLIGSTESKCRVRETGLAEITWESSDLKAGEGLTVAVGFTKGIVQQPAVPLLLVKKNLIGLLTLITALLAAWMVYWWSRFGKDHLTPTVVPLYDVPEGLSPAAVGYLSTGRYHNKLLVASLINLAVKGYVAIHEVQRGGLFRKQQFEIRRLKGLGSDVSLEEGKLYSELFPSWRDAVLVKGEYSSSIARVADQFTKAVTGSYRSLLEKGSNRDKTIVLLVVLSLVYWGMMWWIYQTFHDYFRLQMGAVWYAITLFVAVTFIAADHEKARWFWMLPVLFILLGGYYLYRADYTYDPFFITCIFLAIGGTMLSIFNYLIRKPGKELLRIRSLIDGFKMYLGAAEANLIQFHNPPDLTPEVFERYLPYALVLGVDDIWGERFEKVLQQQAIAYEHRWYSGAGSRSFSTSLTNQLSQNLNQTFQSASTSSRGGSGSGGRGSSGGGGGGGGGGGW